MDRRHAQARTLIDLPRLVARLERRVRRLERLAEELQRLDERLQRAVACSLDPGSNPEVARLSVANLLKERAQAGERLRTAGERLDRERREAELRLVGQDPSSQESSRAAMTR
ncbi:MAG: hypothetical protein U0800_17505 [Isosphaeraceae bacterium]